MILNLPCQIWFLLDNCLSLSLKIENLIILSWEISQSIGSRRRIYIYQIFKSQHLETPGKPYKYLRIYHLFPVYPAGQIHWPVLPVISHSPLFWQYTGTYGSKV